MATKTLHLTAEALFTAEELASMPRCQARKQVEYDFIRGARRFFGWTCLSCGSGQRTICLKTLNDCRGIPHPGHSE